MKLLWFMCLTVFLMSLCTIYCATDSVELTLEIQLILLIVEGILFFIPSAILIQFEGKGSRFAEWCVRIFSLVAGNLVLTFEFAPKEGFNYPLAVFTMNGLLFFFISFCMFSETNPTTK